MVKGNMCIEGLQALRTDIHGAIQSDDSAIEQELILWKAAAERIHNILSEVKKELDSEMV